MPPNNLGSQIERKRYSEEEEKGGRKEENMNGRNMGTLKSLREGKGWRVGQEGNERYGNDEMKGSLKKEIVEVNLLWDGLFENVLTR
jgi:hypothetical protein